MVTSHELGAMRRAISVSAAGLGTTSPNPPVGCVILDAQGKPVGQGYHQRKGESHAEVNALTVAGEAASGGTAVVTLEPCNHHGRTPPCHQALIDAGITRVIVALRDPTSRGDGGIARLLAAGLDVEVGVLESEALLVLAPWLTALQRQRPTLIWTYDILTEGRVGVRQTPRPHGVDVIVDEDRRVLEARHGAHGHGALTLPNHPLSADPHAAVAELYRAGVRSALLHTGPELAQSYLDASLVDEVAVHLPGWSPSSTPNTEALGLVPDGFMITRISAVPGGVELRATRGQR